MQNKNKVFFHYLFITILFLNLNSKSLSQINNSPSNIEPQLLAAFAQIQKYQPFNVDLDCKINSELPFEENLKYANQCDLKGNSNCCKNILDALSVNLVNLNAIEKLHFLIGKASYFDNHQVYDSSTLFAKIANEMAEKNELYSEKAAALLLLSDGAFKRRSVDAAYKWADSALQLSRKCNNKLIQGQSLLQLAFCARRSFSSASHRAFPYYLKAIELANESYDTLTLFTCYMYYATDNFEINNWQEGMPYFIKAVDIAVNSKNLNTVYKLYNSSAYTFFQKGFSKEALVLNKKSLAISQLQNKPYNLEHAYQEIAGIYQEIKQYDTAIFYANLAGNVTGVDSFWSNTWQLKASIYKDMGNYKTAALMYAKALDWSDKDYFSRNQEQIINFETQLNTTEKELQVKQEKKRTSDLEWILGTAIGLLLISVAAYFFQRNARNKLAIQNNTIQKQSIDAEKSLQEKDILLKEIHHRVKNNLTVIGSLLDLQGDSIEDNKAKAAIIEAQNRVLSIALIHQSLYQHKNLSAIEVNGFTNDLLKQLSSIFKINVNNIVTKIYIPTTFLDIDTAVPLGLILNELITNSFKYAFKKNEIGTIEISLKETQPGNYNLVYFDDGPGMPIGFDIKNNQSLGITLIYSLSKQIGGYTNYIFESGSKFTIVFKNTLTRKNTYE